MAIFRAGKRIGPFDIRGGISRGDFKSSAYHRTESDPRFRMQANTDNTIGRFRSAMAAAEGYARSARFAIRVFPPVNLEDQIKMSNKATYLNGQVFDTTQEYTPNPHADIPVSGKYMNDLLSTFGRQVNIHCDSIVMPNKQVQAQEVQYGSEPVRSMVHTHEFPGTIDATFYADKYLRETIVVSAHARNLGLQ